ncbi:hypothetical protein PUNSTDRAFT_99128 [Punctularia strigosozonata HHB-11173 SS5]|uniref:uncharacterized protein n=1 Tax=Punctularia strigosozonata (strain HHB-11173) TaxID=741275 RepID=UPI0004416D25|nr:uncharacterized protein PUNSTDRAFT_99128 [Punctularia strigosozonata HHB-11173 SS5]EIN11849.1 hypothetical protein PUNSTDRAFT_99128 [Punctularia strigosozonata HHB-11173 SS5]
MPRSPTKSFFYNQTSGSSSSPPRPSHSPTKRNRYQPDTLRLQPLGIDPSELVGKVLTRVRRSPNHPNLTLDFADKTSYQIRVDGYDPVHRGVPKELEVSPSLHDILTPGDIGRLTITNCAMITMTDKAFRLDKGKQRDGARREEFEDRWDQNHLGIAFKFEEENRDGVPRWHSVWATLVEHDQELGTCVFRSYDDVYIDRLVRHRHRKRSQN